MHTWKSFFLFSFFFFELAVMMSDYWNPADQVRDPLSRGPSPCVWNVEEVNENLRVND